LCEAGQKSADGWCGAVWACIGDRGCKGYCWGLANIDATACCGHCPVDNEKVPWFHFRPSAKWAQRIFEARTLACALFQMVGLGILSAHPNWMRSEPLGTDKVPQKRSSHPNWMFHLFYVLYSCLILVRKSLS